MLTNMANGIKATETALSSNGSALKENDVYLDSIQGRLSVLSSNFQNLSSNTLNSGFVKSIVDIGSVLINVVDKVGLLNISLIALSGIIASKTSSGITILSTILKQAAISMGLTDATAKTLSTTLSVMIPVAIILAGITIINKYVEAQKEAIKAAVESSNSLKEEKNTLDEYKTKISELREELDSGNLSQTEAYNVRKQLLSIQDSIISKYGEEGSAINILTGNVESLIGALSELSMKQSSDWLAKNYNKIQSAKSFLETPTYIEGSTKGFSEIFKKFGGSTAGLTYGYEGSIDEIIAYYQSIYDYIEDNASSLTDKTEAQISEVLSYLKSQIASIMNTPYYQDYTNLIDEAAYNTIVSKYGEYYNKILAAQSDFNEAMANGDEDQAAEYLKVIQQTQETAIHIAKNDPNFREQIVEFFTNIADGQKSYIEKFDFKDAIESNPTLKEAAKVLSGVVYGTDVEKWTDEQKNAYSVLSDAAKNYISDLSQVETYLNDFGYFAMDTSNASNQIKSLNSDVNSLSAKFKNGTISEEEYKKGLLDIVATIRILRTQYPELAKELNVVLASISNSLNTLPSIIAEFQEAANNAMEATKTLSSSLSTMKSAFAEQNDEGEISVETMLSVIDAGYAAALSIDKETGSVTLNKDAFIALTKAKIAEQKASNLSARNALITKLDEEKKKVQELLAVYAQLFAFEFITDMSAYNAYQDELNGTSDDLQGQIDILDAYDKMLGKLEDSLGGIVNATGKSSKSEKTWAEKEEEYYKDYINDIEHAIFLLSKQAGTEEEQIALYKKLQEFVHKEADLFRKMGYDENSDWVQSLQSMWWSFEDKIKDINDQILQDQKDSISKVLDAAKSMLDYQIFVSESMMNMYDENSEAYAAEAQKQIEYLQQIQKAALDALNAYAAMGLAETDELVQSALRTWWDAQNNIVSIQKSLYQDSVDAEKEAWEKSKELFEDKQEAMQDLVDLTVELIKKEKEDQIEVLEDQIDKYEEIIDAKKESLQATKDEYEYQKNLQSKVNDISDLQNRIAELDLDNSREGQAEKAKLLEELAELQSSLDDTQYDHSVELQENALDDELEKFKTEKESEIKVIQDYLDQAGQLVQDAINRIQTEGESLFQSLLSYSATYGDGIQENVINMWEQATSALSEYGSVAASLAATFPDFVATTQQPDYSTVQTPSYGNSNTTMTEDEIIAQMKANSQAWFSASEADRQKLHEANKALAALLGLVYERDYDSSTGKWMRNGVPLYHKGQEAGFVGGSKYIDIRDKENLAILQGGEVISTRDQLAGMANAKTQAIKDAATNAANMVAENIVNNTPVNINVTSPITIPEGTPTNLVKFLKQYGKDLAELIANEFNATMRKRGGGRMDRLFSGVAT